MTRPFSQLLALALAVVAMPAFAQSLEEREAEEMRLRQAFVDGATQVVEDLNRGSFGRFVAAIDKDEMLERIFGIRLIDPRAKRDFRDSMKEDERFAGFIQSQFAMEAAEGIKARLLVVESRGDRGRAVVRYDMPYFQVNYHEYDLTLDDKGRLVIVDWTDYFWGHRFSDRMGLSMIQAQPNKNAVRKLIDFPNVREQQVFQVVEVLKATRDKNFDRYFEIVNGLSEELKRQPVVIKVGIDATRQARRRRAQREVLVSIDKYFPEEPLYSIALLDLYFPGREYEKAYNALVRLDDKLDAENDGVMSARLSSAALVLGRAEESIALAEHSVATEPDLELGWWALLRAQVAARQYEQAVEALTTLEGTFGHSLGPDALGKDPAMQEFARSDAYRQWFAGRSS